MCESPELTEDARRNQAHWDRDAADDQRRNAEHINRPEPAGWTVPESEVGALPEVAGKDVVELGCGTAYWSALLARRGARMVAVDLTPSQLEIARMLQLEHGLEFPLLEANAEDVPPPDESFELAFSEYGASIWCDPSRWIPEAAWLLRRGGELVFMRSSVIGSLCTPHDEDGKLGRELVRDHFGLGRFKWPDGTVEFTLDYGDTIRLLRASGFALETMFELQAPPDATTHPVYDYVTADWARQWPAEEIWVARKCA